MPTVEEELAASVEKLLYDKGQQKMQTRTHFEIGQSLHADTFYYAKSFFQSLQNNRAIASLLGRKIQDVFKDSCNDITLVSYGDYAAQFLFETVSWLSKNTLATTQVPIFNYALIDNSREEFSFFYEPVHLCTTLVIVLPLTCTYSTAFKIKDFLRTNEFNKRYHEKTISENIFCCFLVYHELMPQILNDQFFSLEVSPIGVEERVIELYRSFQWKQIENRRIVFSERIRKENMAGHFLIPLPAKLSAPENCRCCFPQKPQTYKDELSLFPTKSNHDTPNLVFGVPQFANFEGKFYTRSILRVKMENSHLFGHLKSFHNSILHYIKNDVFYEENAIQILHFFKTALLPLLSTKEAQNKLLFITPKHNRASKFLQDLLHCSEFENTEVTTMILDTKSESLENYRKEYKRYSGTHKFVYFDYVMSSAEAFTRINEELIAYGYHDGFDRVLIVIDRTTEYSKRIILRMMQNKSTVFYGFLKLHVPLMRATGHRNAIQDKLLFLKELLADSHLDGLKMYIGHEIKRTAPKRREELDQEFSEKVGSVEKLRYLNKLRLSHYISAWLHENRDRFEDDDTTRSSKFSAQDLQILIDRVRKHYRFFFSQKDLLAYKDRTIELQDSLEEIVIKTLARPPFKNYLGIYQIVFHYCKEKLMEILSGLSKDANEMDVRKFKFYTRRTVELNSNFIISAPYIEKLRALFSNDASVPLRSIKYFVLRAFKELIFKNPTRSIRLEELINNKVYWPAPLQDSNMSLSAALQDEFYQLGRIIKAENIHLLNELKKLFIANLNVEHRLVRKGANLQVPQTPKEEKEVRKDLNELFLLLGRETPFHIPILHKLKVLREQKQEFLISHIEKIKAVAQQAKKFQPSNNDICLFIDHNYLFGKNTLEEPVLRLSREFLRESRFDDSGQVASRLVRAMLGTIFQLETKKRKKENFVANIKSILDNACRVIGDDLTYAFFIEYKEKNEIGENNIYTVTSCVDDDAIHQPGLHKDGFLYQMLYGLKDAASNEANTQTFIALAKDDDENIHSFREEYYLAANTGDASVDQPVSPQALLLDYGPGYAGKLLQSAKMILLFRLSNILLEPGYNSPIDKGQAVFAICYPAEKIVNTPDSTPTSLLTDFINVERVRLLLLIKEELLEYLQRQFESDAFISLLEERRVTEFKRSMEHGMQRYFNAMQSILAKKKLAKEDIFLLDFLRRTLNTHAFTLSKTSFELSQKDYPLVTRQRIVEIFDCIMEAPYLANGYIPKGERKLTVVVNNFNCHPIVVNQIVPEIIRNMRRNALYYFQKPKLFSISYENRKLIFENSYNPAISGEVPQLNPVGGLKMCNDILDDLNLPRLITKPSDSIENRFVTILDLNFKK